MRIRSRCSRSVTLAPGHSRLAIWPLPPSGQHGPRTVHTLPSAAHAIPALPLPGRLGIPDADPDARGGFPHHEGTCHRASTPSNGGSGAHRDGRWSLVPAQHIAGSDA